MNHIETSMLADVYVLQWLQGDVPAVGLRALDLAGQMGLRLGAQVSVHDAFETPAVGSFVSRDKQVHEGTLGAWLAGPGLRVVLMVASDPDEVVLPPDTCAVILGVEALASEATLFASSGLADLLGDPQRAPLIPRGEYGAGTVAYGVLAGLTALVAKRRRTGLPDVARVDATGVLSWVNWKAAAAGGLGAEVRREGDNAEWPVIACADGHVALVYQQRDWPQIVAMVGDERLGDERFARPRQRAQHRDEYMEMISSWAATRSKAQIMEQFLAREIPAAPVMTAADLLTDPLLLHRDAFSTVGDTLSPRLAHRVAAHSADKFPTSTTAGELPLSGLTVLDLGIITAGAGVSALLADLGAEVLKVESHTYPDPFRQWAGEAVSPLFKCNNRNKHGLALDLKDAQDKARFLELVARADVVVENFRRGVLDRLGLGYEALRAVNPGIMLASISGQGLSGPGCGASSFGSTLEASSGFSAQVSYDEGVPYITGRNVNYPDQTVVLYAAAVIAAALSQPKRGMHLDISQRDVAVFLAGADIERVSAGEAGAPQANGRAYRTADGDWLAFDDTAVALEPSADAWVAARRSAEAIAELARHGVGAALALLGSQMYAAQTAAAHDVFATSPDGAMVKGFPFQLVNAPFSVRLNSPEVGEHTDQFV
ncbi:MAG: CoA transferase [Pseudomonadota bacterium]